MIKIFPDINVFVAKMTIEGRLPYKLNVSQGSAFDLPFHCYSIRMHCFGHIQFVWEITFVGHFDYEDIDVRKKFDNFSRATGYQLSTVQI